MSPTESELVAFAAESGEELVPKDHGNCRRLRAAKVLGALGLVAGACVASSFVLRNKAVSVQSDGAALRGGLIGLDGSTATEEQCEQIINEPARYAACEEICHGEDAATLNKWSCTSNQWRAGATINYYADQIQWSGEKPSSAMKTQDSTTLENNGDTEATFTGTLSTQVGSTITNTVTSSSATTGSATVEFGVPETWKVSLGISHTSTISNEKATGMSKTTTYTQSVSTSLKPGEKACFLLKCSTATASASYSIPQCLEGSFTCNYGDDRCNGHYYWFGDFVGMKGPQGPISNCGSVKGTSDLNSVNDCTVEQKSGACPEDAEGA
eukprot:TRINITY_DN5004_c0_g1_i4.p1 TRINITY_DN5004_c0_g1~~TRINITY_DN5004_c0_g1_i4.p1  ORF type:complete len:351 (+),score=47.49 TRINITY_DN5004_c0_g1_i4:78-1055(+)